ncbi:hypothetical protein N431DRAFT_466267 [Stipitochalara longipes BDJ]|nr:hypothetical protein N431DRAFT_466267 [Stipitochalara longipes BDJ]
MPPVESTGTCSVSSIHSVDELSLQISIGPRRRTCHYHLNTPIRNEYILAAFYEASVTWRKCNNTESFSIRLPRAEAGVFGQLINWMNHEPLDTFEEEGYDDEETHVSEWLILHILAVKFCIKDLAVEALQRYKSCRSPHWEGLWLPLPTEIAYIIDNDHHSTEVKCVIARHIMSQCFSYRCAGNLGKIAILLSCDEHFTLAVLRAVRDHMSESIAVARYCEFDGCMHHSQHWSQSDIEKSDRPLSEAGFSGFTELVVLPPADKITRDDEDAMEAAEVLEALSEAHNSGWIAINAAS